MYKIQLNNFVEQTPRESDSRSTMPEIPPLLWNSNFPCRIHRSSVLKQASPVHILTPYFLIICLHIIPPYAAKVV
jgi:hypothetical protein